MLIAGILGAVGSIVGVMAQVSQLQYQAAIAKANAEQQRINAEAAFEAAQVNARDIGFSRKGERGEIEVARGGSGFNTGSLSFGLGDVAFTDIAVQEQTRTVQEGQQAYTYYQNAARIEDTRADAFKAAVGPTILGGLLNTASNFIGGAVSNSNSPGYIGIPKRRIVSPSIGLA